MVAEKPVVVMHCSHVSVSAGDAIRWCSYSTTLYRISAGIVELVTPSLQTKRKYNTYAYQRQTGGAMVVIQLSCKTNGSAAGTI